MPRFAQTFSMVLILMLILSACSAAAPTVSTQTVVDTNTPPPAGGQAGEDYPAGEPALSNPPAETYPGPPLPTDDPLAQYPETLPAVQPVAGKGAVTGRVLEPNNTVFLAPSLFLGRLTYPNDPNAAPPLVGFSETTSPQGVQDRTGKFVFTDIEPGTYAVVVWTPGSSTLLNDQEGNTAIIEVVADQVADMGDIFIP